MDQIKITFVRGFFLLLLQVMVYSSGCLSIKLDFLDDFDPQGVIKNDIKIPIGTPMAKSISSLYQQEHLSMTYLEKFLSKEKP